MESFLAAILITGGVLCFFLLALSDVRARMLYARHVFYKDRHEEAALIINTFRSAIELELEDAEEDEDEITDLSDPGEEIDPVAARELAMLDELNGFADNNPDSFANLIHMSIKDEKPNKFADPSAGAA